MKTYEGTNGNRLRKEERSLTAYQEDHLLSADGHTKIPLACRQPEQVIGVGQIAHGISEYGKRYEDFAGFRCGHGFAVMANDPLSHDRSIEGGQRTE